MSNRDEKIKRMVELILAWDRLRATVWPAAKSALEEEINKIGEELFPEAP